MTWEHICSTVRITGVAKNTVTKLLVDLGRACEEYQFQNLRNLNCQRVQCDEIWSFVSCKKRNISLKASAKLVLGDVWTWTALDADTKQMVSWWIGERDTCIGARRSPSQAVQTATISRQAM